MSTTNAGWINASFYLPRLFPVEVELKSGNKEKRDTAEGDWREVRKWRPLKKGAK